MFWVPNYGALQDFAQVAARLLPLAGLLNVHDPNSVAALITSATEGFEAALQASPPPPHPPLICARNTGNAFCPPWTAQSLVQEDPLTTNLHCRSVDSHTQRLE